MRPEPITLTELCARYLTEVDVFNDTPHASDEESDRHAARTYLKTEDELFARPAVTAEDALAVLELCQRHLDEVCGGADDTTDALLRIVRGFLERAAAA